MRAVFGRSRLWVLGAMAAVLCVPATGLAQLRTRLVASGFASPLEFVQDPSNPAVQYVVEQGGRIRVLNGGVVQSTDFLNVSGDIAAGGEQGLLGLAFPSNYGATGRFYVFFTNTAGDLVLSRFLRSANPLVAEVASRLDLRWSTGQRSIAHPGQTNHNGGHLAFGPDGFLYVAVGDGGGGGDDPNNAQNLDVLLGKLLRIDVTSVGGSNTDGFVVPADNPFIGRGRPEIWALGLRNPWKFSFDVLTGAILIADVGQGLWEEIDYEPANSGGRNYGWSLREGGHEYAPSKTPGVLPLEDPIFEYDHGVGRSITGGFVYRGTALGPSFAGRYFFADFVTRRVWSMAIATSGAGDPIGTDVREHTSELGVIGSPSAFGTDANHELYLVSHSRGEILKLIVDSPIVVLDGAVSSGVGLEMSGWAIDRRATASSGIDSVHFYAYGSSGSPTFMGQWSAPFLSRPDVGALFGPQFQMSGFRLVSPQWVAPGPATVVAYAHSSMTGLFEALAGRPVTIVPRRDRLSFVDQYPASSVMQPFTISGWAIDRGVTTAPPLYGTGIGPIFIDIFVAGSGAFVQSVPAAYGFSRPDVAAIFGARFQNSGFAAQVMDLRPGSYVARIRYWMGAAADNDVVPAPAFTVTAGPMLAIDTPQPGATVPGMFTVGGWAIDLRPGTGTGVNLIHVWAYPTSGAPPIFVGAPSYGVIARPDVAAAFNSSRFTDSGYNQTVGPLAPGTYDLVVWARSTVTNTFAINRVVRVTVP